MPDGTPQIPRPRIQTLSDLIFGLALSIGAIELVGNVPATPSALSYDILFFGFSFLILISVWNRYASSTSAMPVETPVLVRANVVLLFLVAIEPFLFDIMTSPSGVSEAVGIPARIILWILTIPVIWVPRLFRNRL